MDSESQGGEEWMPTFFVGHHETNRKLPITSRVLEQALNCNYDILTTPITNHHFYTRVNALISDHLSGSTVPTVSPLTNLDTDLEPGEVTSTLLAFTSSWIDICSPDPLISGISRQVLLMEVAYAAFCGMDFLFIQGPRLYHRDPFSQQELVTNNVVEYARSVLDSLSTGHRLHIFIVMRMGDEAADSDDKILGTREEYLDDVEEERLERTDGLGTWDAWNAIRTLCKYHSRLFVALEIPRNLPPLYVQSRWFSEPIKAMMFPDSTFPLNKHGHPYLQPPARAFIKRIMRLKVNPWIILQNVGPIPGLENPDERVPVADGFLSPEAAAYPTLTEAAAMKKEPEKPKGEALAHLNYIRHLQRNQPPRSEVERYGSGYQDYLQVPLQPLADNLESMTYEVFEKDPVKYDLYEQAIQQALFDWKREKKPGSSFITGYPVVAVCGAGRGPLVTRALKASKAAGMPIELWALEKNQNAYVLLQRHNRTDWDNKVRLVQSDMRSWRGPSEFHPKKDYSKQHYPVDILISELLGSFADNELSPECLDGITHLLARPHGISIPRSYTTYLTPIAAPKIHADIASRATYEPTAPETPAVVWLHAIDYLSPSPATSSTASTAAGVATSAVGTAEPAPVANILSAWTFAHSPLPSAYQKPKPGDPAPLIAAGSNAHNARRARLRFRTRYRGVCHGLAGYFESVLYPGVELSTNPNTMEGKSRGMISWFPIFFPLKTPIYFPSASALDVSIWRQTDGRKVWYEWMVESWGWNLLRVGGVGRSESGASRGEEGMEVDKGKGKERERDWNMVRLGMTDLHSSIKNGCLM